MSAGAAKLGHQVADAPFFDTVRVNVKDAGKLVKQAESQGINLRQLDNSCVTVAFDETTRCTAACQTLQALQALTHMKSSGCGLSLAGCCMSSSDVFVSLPPRCTGPLIPQCSMYTLDTDGQRRFMVCRIEDVDDLFKAFNGGKAADFTAEDLADQVCIWPAWLCLSIDCVLPVGRSTGHRAFVCQAGACSTRLYAAWLVLLFHPNRLHGSSLSLPTHDPCHSHVACLQVETGVGSFKRSSKFLQQPIFNLYQVGAALCVSSLQHARRQMYTAAAVDK